MRNLRDQLQRKDLHLDLLRRKLTLHEDSTRLRSLLEAERDDANQRFTNIVILYSFVVIYILLLSPFKLIKSS